MPSTTLSPPTFRDNNKHRNQSSLASSRKSMKANPLKEVVLHHPMASPPPEDWILFPEEVIVTKHSSVRDCRSRNLMDSRVENPRRPWIKLDRTEAEAGEYSHVRQDMQRRKETPSALSTSQYLLAPTSAAKRCDAKTQPEPKFPERLPTPDLSDVDEDGFWSCCGSSESSA